MSDIVNVRVGTVGRAHGLKGEVTMRVSTDEPERRLAPGAQVRVDRRPMVIAGARHHSGSLLVSFEGVHDRSAAEALSGADVWAAVLADEVPTADDEYYDRRLVGLAVHDHTGVRVGEITAVAHLPAHDSLVIRTADGDFQVPFVSALVPVVDLDAGEVHLADVGGLLGDADAGDPS